MAGLSNQARAGRPPVVAINSARWPPKGNPRRNASGPLSGGGWSACLVPIASRRRHDDALLDIQSRDSAACRPRRVPLQNSTARKLPGSMPRRVNVIKGLMPSAILRFQIIRRCRRQPAAATGPATQRPGRPQPLPRQPSGRCPPMNAAASARCNRSTDIGVGNGCGAPPLP